MKFLRRHLVTCFIASFVVDRDYVLAFMYPIGSAALFALDDVEFEAIIFLQGLTAIGLSELM
jgi:hypothetical protein